MAKRLVAGRHSVFEALKVRPKAITNLYLEEGSERKKWHDEFLKLAAKVSVKVQIKKKNFFSNLAHQAQGLACELNENPVWPVSLEKKENAFLLALDRVEDPQNLGAILRTAWLMGVDGIMISDRDSSPLSALACKVASGGAEHVPIKRIGNLKNEIASLKEQGFWSYALAVDASAQNITSVPKSNKTILIAGAEEAGIRPTLIKDSDFKVYIPQVDASASYNVSVAVGMSLALLKL